MRLRVGLALVLSLFLIAGSAVARLTSKPSTEPYLETITAENILLGDETTSLEVADLGSADETTKTPEKLTTTDLISRQLFGDYFDLVSTGAATDENINALAESYAEGIAKMAQSSRVSAVDLNIVPDSQATVNSYKTWFVKAITSYRALTDKEFSLVGDIDVVGPKLTSLGTKVSAIYLRQLDEFKAQPVPQSFLSDHLALTNAYSNNVLAFEAIARASKDPIEAVSGLAAVQKNDINENLIIQNIAAKLGISGIISPNQ